MGRCVRNAGARGSHPLTSTGSSKTRFPFLATGLAAGVVCASADRAVSAVYGYSTIEGTAHMAEIKGIGGVFFESDDAKSLAEWYEQVLGIDLLGHEDGFFHVFPHVEVGTGIARENPVFAINQSGAPLAAENRGFMINFRVDDLDAYLERLAGHGVSQDREMVVWERGKHAWVRDRDGNLIELYEELIK